MLSIVNSHSLHLSVSFWLFSLLLNLSVCNFLGRHCCIPLRICPLSSITLLSVSLFHSISLPFFAAPSPDSSSPLYFCRCLFCFGDWGWLCGAERFFAPHTVCGQGQLWPFLSVQGATDLQRQAGRSRGKKIKRLVPQKWFDLPLVRKCVPRLNLALLFLSQCHPYLNKTVSVMLELYSKQL